MKQYARAAPLIFTTTAYAGYGGMGSVDDGDGGPVDLGSILLGALLIGVGIWLWNKFF